MSTISTQLNWGSSYIVFDFYKQQINPGASEKRLVAVGRISTVVLMVLSALVALLLQNALGVFNLLLVFGAGTGLIFILRWFWWRINAWSEITAMFASGIVSLVLAIPSVDTYLFNETDGLLPSWSKFILVVLITSVVWIVSTFITKPEDKKVLFNFYKKIQPGGPGWNKIVDQARAENIEIVTKKEKWSVPSGILAMLIGCVLIYSCMFAMGYYIYGNHVKAFILTGVAFVSGWMLIKVWKKIKSSIL